jgi:hypothetical protein
MLGKTFKGLIAALVMAGALGGASAAVATVSQRPATSLSLPTHAPARRHPRVEEGCRELPIAPVTPPPPASCS